jgi:uncharacterized protein
MAHSQNRLSTETSPYLLQHASNPINWFSWGNEAFAKAKEENKLMLISVGYSSCHWCHVMEKEAFSNAQVAEFMNNHYVCVKVDREERPDVDKIYMNAVQIITRSGGWPLNCFALPNGQPVYGGTYFPTEAWLDIIKSLHFTWMSEPKRVLDVADELSNGVSNTEIIKGRVKLNEFSADYLQSFVKDWERFFDSRYGGNKGAPKFTLPGSLQFLLDFSWTYNNEPIRDHVRLTLDKISRGGLFDHLGGGFFRYSVDEQWYVPHFEKMLYDNAQMVSLFSLAYKHFGDENYRDIVYQTIDFLRREMRSPEGGFYSAIDADSEGEEGRFYTFSKVDVDSVLGLDSEIFSIYYGVNASGNHLGKNVLREAASIQETACLLGIEPHLVSDKLKFAKRNLLNARNSRVRPITDDKHILSWNALVIKSLVEAYIVFGDKRFLTDAENCASFIEDKLVQSDGSLFRIYCKDVSSIPAFFDDYSFLADAYISLFKATYNEEWLFKAKRLTDIAYDKFFCNESGMFFYTTNNHDNVFVRKMELTDGVIPSSNAVMAGVLIELGAYFSDQNYEDISKQMLANICMQIEKGGPYVYKWADIYLKQLIGKAEVVASGDNAIDWLKNILSRSNHHFIIPYYLSSNTKLDIGINQQNNGTIKLCVDKTCKAPTSNPLEIIDALNETRPLGK